MSQIRVRVDVPADHLVKLPDEVPVGPVEILVLTAEKVRGGLSPATIAAQLIRSSPPQRSDSTKLIREDRTR